MDIGPVGQEGAPVLLKTSEETFDEEFVRSRGIDWVSISRRSEGWYFRGRAEVTVNRDDLRHRLRPGFDLHDTVVREYRDVRAEPGQVLHRDGVLLPETFRHFRLRELVNENLLDLGPTSARSRYPDMAFEPLRGTFYYLDTEVPTIYGHLVTEVVSRLWAWDEALAEHSDLKALVFAPPGADDVAPWFRETLRAYGIPDERLHVATRPVTVERLIGATPLFSNVGYAHPDLVAIWRRIKKGLFPLASRTFKGSKVFITRGPTYQRHCVNGAELEAHFESAGFEVVRPETLALADQATVFSNARVVAGYGGSGMLNMIYGSGGGRRLVICSEGYNAVNEYQIASVLGDRIDYVYCPVWPEPMLGGWNRRYFNADFRFDFAQEGPWLTHVVAEEP
jgi:hypothetical protein